MNKQKIATFAWFILLMAAGVFAVGNFAIQYPAGTDKFIVDSSGNVTMKGTLLNASTTTSALFGTDAISESAIDFNTACASGSHYYLNGNDLACEANTVGIPTDQNNYTSAIGWNVTAGVATLQLARTGLANLTANLLMNDTTRALAGNCAAGQFMQNATATGVQCAAPSGSGTVQWIANGTGLTGGNITVGGSITLNDAYVATIVGNWSADKAGIQANITNVNATANLKVAKAGDTMTGDLVMSAGIDINLSNTGKVQVAGSSYFTIDSSGNVLIVLV